jgi:nucleoside-diphosphate-sugar epimerase
MSSKLLVTGGSGYLATQLIAALLRDGREVRATVRSLDGEAGVREAVRRGGADDAGLELVAADLTSDDGWPAALEGVEEVHHVASPIPSSQPKDPDELIVPAREGTVRVLKAARDVGARRVVLTSSFAAVGYTPKAVRDYTEADWTDPDTPGLAPYPRSKAIAERAAWDFIDTEGGDTQLVVMNPTFIAGPSLVPALRSTLTYFKMIIEGTMPALPRQRFGVVDVRDVADAHITAMATPAAAGKRYLLLADGPTITWLGLARILRDHLGSAGEHVTTAEAPGEDPLPLTIHNDRAKQELDWRPRPAETTIVETAESLSDLGLLDPMTRGNP